MKKIIATDGEVYYEEKFLTHEQSLTYFTKLQTEIEWQEKEIILFGKSILQPRLVAFYGDLDKPYTYSKTLFKPHSWTPTLLELKQRVEEKSQTTFTSVLLNYYRSGQDSMGWHADDEKELGPEPIISSLSLGAERDFQFKHRRNPELRVTQPLQSGSLLVMRGKTQQNWLHQLPKRLKTEAPRINLTFRVIL